MEKQNKNQPARIALPQDVGYISDDDPDITNREFIYILSSPEAVRENKFKVGYHAGTKYKLKGRYITEIPEQILFFFKHGNRAIESVIKEELAPHRILNVNDNLSEWVHLELEKIIAIIAEIRERVFKHIKINRMTYKEKKFLEERIIPLERYQKREDLSSVPTYPLNIDNYLPIRTLCPSNPLSRDPETTTYSLLLCPNEDIIFLNKIIKDYYDNKFRAKDSRLRKGNVLSNEERRQCVLERMIYLDLLNDDVSHKIAQRCYDGSKVNLSGLFNGLSDITNDNEIIHKETVGTVETNEPFVIFELGLVLQYFLTHFCTISETRKIKTSIFHEIFIKYVKEKYGLSISATAINKEMKAKKFIRQKGEGSLWYYPEITIFPEIIEKYNAQT